MKPRILLTGADGLLGSALHPILDEVGVVVAPGLDEFDLLQPGTVRETIEGVRPDIIVHLAAEARVDYCEENPDEAYKINALGTAQVAIAGRHVGSRVMVMSSDYVFDGTQSVPYREYQEPAPLNHYGRSKLEAERSILTLVPNSLVIRSSSIYGTGGRHFVGAILSAAKGGQSLRVVDDQVQSPTWAGHLAPALARLAVADVRGILHLSGNGECTWFEFARAILECAGLDVKCDPVSTERINRPAPRPPYSVLSCDLAEQTIGIRLPDWREGLSAYLSGGGG